MFDATNDVVNCASNQVLDDIVDLTVSAWIYVNGAGENNFGNIVAKSTSGGAIGWFTAMVEATPKLGLYRTFTGTDGDWRELGSTAVISGQWNHVAITYNNSLTTNVPGMYINGNQVTVGTASTPTGSADPDNAANLFIGNDDTNAGTFNGMISDVTVWKTILTDKEIKSIAQSRIKGQSLVVNTKNIVGYWPLDDFLDNSITTLTVRDRSAFYNNGTPSGGPINKAESTLSYP